MIINADDFGLNESVNAAIVESFQRGFISSTTIMPVMPGFADACELAGRHGLAGHIGLHFTLTEGAPLSEPIRRCPRLCGPDGQMIFRVSRATLRLTAREQAALAEELRAQVNRCRQAGLPLTHLDSHHHAHTTWGVTSVILRVAGELGIPYVRISRNCGAGKSLVKRMYTAVYNARLGRAGVRRTRYFGSVDDFLALKASGAADYRDVEVMVHPLYGPDGTLLDKVHDRAFAPAIEPVVERAEAVSFGGAHYQRLTRAPVSGS